MSNKVCRSVACIAHVRELQALGTILQQPAKIARPSAQAVMTMARKSLTLVSVGPLSTESPSA